MKSFILLIFALSFQNAFAQSYYYDWGKAFKGNGQDISLSIAVDQNGSSITTGYFQSTVDFNPGPGVFNLTSTGGFSENAFISKLDSNGNFLWAKSIGGRSFGNSVAVDKFNNIVITGFFNGTADFDPGIGTAIVTPVGATGNAYILKLDSDGNYLWVKTLSGSAEGNGISVDKSNNICVIGKFTNTVDFDPGVGTYYLGADATSSSAFNLKLDKNGNYLWSKKLGGYTGTAIAVDRDNNVFSIGDFIGTKDFDPSGTVYNLTSSGSQDIYITKLDSNGEFLWAKNVGGKQTERALSICTDKLGDVYLSGTFYDLADFDPDPLVTVELKSPKSVSSFILKLNSWGNYKWARLLEGSVDANAIAIDTLKNLYITGLFQDSMILSSESSTTLRLKATAFSDIFITTLDSSGDFIWAKNLEGLSGTGHSGNSIAVDKFGSILTTGNFGGRLDFDPSKGIDTLSPDTTIAGGSSIDIFVHKMKLCRISKSISETACKSYLSPSKKYVWTISGKYVDKIELFDGCDSVINIDLTVKHLDVNVSNLSPVLTAHEVAATYQWFNCDSPTKVLSTSKTFTASKNGKYKVVISKDGCTDTSYCYTVANVSLKDFDTSQKDILIYPNPTNDQLNIQYKLPVDVEFIDLMGRLLHKCSNTNQLSVEHLENGYYFLKIFNHQTGEYLSTQKIIIKK